MKLSQLFSIYTEYHMGDNPTGEVRQICSDSRVVEENDVFVAVRGTTFDGHSKLDEVAQKKPAGIVAEDVTLIPADYGGAVVKVDDSRLALAKLSHKMFSSPSDDMYCIGVTGTNGKTSITYMVEKILTDFGWPTGVLGTVDHHLGERVWATHLTTPGPIELAERLYQMKSVGAKAIVMEVSSHALSQRRAHGLSFDVGVFSNLTRDHLDYHDSMQSYFSEKELLFTHLLANPEKENRAAVVNMDDSWGQQIQVEPGVKWLGYGQHNANLKLSVLKMDFSGTRYCLVANGQEYEGFLPVPGDFSIYNAVAAIGACLPAGVSVESCIKSLETFSGVPGRLERVATSNNVYAFVDYAHTDDALKSVLKVLNDIRKFSKDQRKIICLFGCGGDRDPGKRPMMMQAALEGADEIYVTSDNPRTEDPQQIIDDVIADVPESLLGGRVRVQVDRKTSILQALGNAESGDILLVAGKGHENYQLVDGEVLPFSDQEIIREFV